MNRLIRNILLFFAPLLLGCIITAQIRTSQLGVGIVTPDTIPQLSNELHNYKAEIESLKLHLEGLEKNARDYQEAMEKQGNLNEILEKQLENVNALAGLSDLEGPGIEIMLDDSRQEIVGGKDPNLLLVHDEDILTVVSELKAAGAEAISINGQRIMHNSEIRCGGPTINVNSVRYAPPYVITAIGDADTLYGYMGGPESGYLDILEYYGLQVNIQKKDKVIVPAYRDNVNLKYIKMHKEGE